MITHIDIPGIIHPTDQVPGDNVPSGVFRGKNMAGLVVNKDRFFRRFSVFGIAYRAESFVVIIQRSMHVGSCKYECTSCIKKQEKDH